MAKRYSKEEIERILKSEQWEYHRVELPYGLHTPGQDREKTLSLIYPQNFYGGSVLDIGCGIGFFCFAAEKRNAKKIVGIELKEHRYRQALILKDILNSNVEFILGDFEKMEFKELFDYVLLLNVIHHVRDPIFFLKKASLLTKKRMIIEFPTLKDKNFKKVSHLICGGLFNHFPLIGVSSSRVDQTFVFTPAAIRAILDHEQMFSSVEIIKSPMRGRMIAICNK